MQSKISKSLIMIPMLVLFCFQLWSEALDFADIDFFYLSPAVAQEQTGTLEARIKKNPDDFKILKYLGIYYSIIAESKKDESYKKSIEYLEKARKIQSDPCVDAYLGSAWALAGDVVANPIDKMNFTKKGLAIFDKAVAVNPDNLDLRLGRLLLDIQIPDFFKVSENIKKDYDFIKSKYAKGTSDKEKAVILLAIGEYYVFKNNIDSALKSWNKALETFPKSEKYRDYFEAYTKKRISTY
jgi:tetratricopeptide (TPR) repeat protein